MKFRAFAFDLDGTLIDSQIDFISLRKDLSLTKGEPILEAISTWPDEQREHALKLIHDYEIRGALSSRRIEGACEFLEKLLGHEIPVGIFTRNSRATANWSLERHAIQVDLVITRDEGNPKPDPQGLLKIAQDFKVKPSEMLFVGDYIYDLQAGLRAGVPTALYLPAEPDFDTTGAQFIFQNYLQLQEWSQS